MKSQNQQLQEQAENLANEVKFLRKENKELHKEISKAGQDGPTMDMAKLLKRYYEIEEQFGQMKKDIKQDMKHALAKKEKKIVQQVQEHILQNDKRTQEALMDTEQRIQEAHMVNIEKVQEALAESENTMQKTVETQMDVTKDYVRKQVEENEKYLQERLGVNEVKVWAHSQEIQQNIAKHDQHVQASLRAKEAKIQQDVMAIIDERVQKVYEIQKIGETARVVCGDTINEEGYFTRLLPLQELPDNVIEISGEYGRVIIYVERKKIERYEAS
ncbi:hypothetical protein BZA77DRAFT_292985 [Pyronema omphalodes]|nr:hypothetical protein BZA77DRAFT_292985 [Pyronema omphalodes]